MARFSEVQLLSEIRDKNEKILPLIAKKYFPSAGRFLRLRGFSDEQTPVIFSDVLLDAFVTLTENPAMMDVAGFNFEEYFFGYLKTFVALQKKEKHLKESQDVDENHLEVLARCVDLLDDDYRKLLFARMIKKLSFEKIASVMNFSNPVIAQYEYNKACNQLQAIIAARIS